MRPCSQNAESTGIGPMFSVRRTATRLESFGSIRKVEALVAEDVISSGKAVAQLERYEYSGRSVQLSGLWRMAKMRYSGGSTLIDDPTCRRFLGQMDRGP